MANMTSSASAAQVAAELSSASIDQIEALVDRYSEDPRAQVQKACERALKRLSKERAERERVDAMYETMVQLGGEGIVVGVDEVGRGSVAGPLTVCAVCLPSDPRIWGINDSKQLTPRKARDARRSNRGGCNGCRHLPYRPCPHRRDRHGPRPS